MDHKTFENTMIDYVNRNSKSAEEARRDAYLADRAKAHYKQRSKKRDAAVRMVVWIGAYLVFVLCAVYLSWFKLLPGEFVALICSIVGLVAGFKLSALWRVFRK